MARKQQIPDERFTCESCGRCCRMWTITVSEDKVEQLRRVDWPGGDPFVRRKGEGDAYHIRMVDGHCFFLDEDNHCRIHNELGYAAKPEGCKAFPLLVGRVAGTTHLRLSFYCPTVSGGRGKPLSEQRRWVQATVKSAGGVERSAPLTLEGEIELTLRDLDQIEAQLVRLLEQTEPSVADRVAAGAALLRRLGQAVQQQGKAALSRTLAECQQLPLAELAAEGRDGAKPSRAGPVLSLFLAHDCPPGSASRMGQFFRVRAFNLRLARLRSHLMQASASWSQILALPFAPPAASRRLLTRYLLHKLRSRRILSGEHSLLSGYNTLATAYTVVSILARLRAAHAGRSAVDEQDVELAVHAADLLVVEHTALYSSGMLGDLTEAVLAAEDLAGCLLARAEPVRNAAQQ